MQTLELNNVGPVSHVSIPVPEGGGIVVLRGRNGRGKTKTLEAIESAISGRGKLDVRDGSLNGDFTGFGVTIKVGSKTTRKGDLVIQSLEGKLSVASLVDPGIKEPDAADARRIKALVQLANVLPSAELFYGLIGSREEFEKYVGSNALGSTDLVSMADRIKRDFHQCALKAEGEADHAEGRARGAREAAADVDVSVETDAAKLQQALHAAVREEERLKAERDTAAKAKEAAQLARDQLADAEATYMGQSLATAVAAEEQAKATQVAAEAPAKELAAKLQEAKHARDLTKQAWESAEAASRQSRANEGKAKASVTTYQNEVETLRLQLARAEQGLGEAASRLMTASLEAEEMAAKAVAAVDADTNAASLFLDAQSHLADASRANELACQAVASAIAARKAAEAHESSMAQWRKQVAAAEVSGPPEAALDAAAVEVSRCNTAIEQATLARRAKLHLAEATDHAAEAKEARNKAVRLREAAKGTDEVLSGVVSKSSDVLRVEIGRLVLTTSRGATYFGDLSHGERWKIALDIAIDAVGPNGVLMIPQEAWESLDFLNRELIRNHVIGRGVTILTAETSGDDEITAEVLA